MLKLLQFLLCITFVSSSCGPKDTIINEGKVLCCYYDTKHIPTIGIGFNLQRTDASNVLSKYNLKLANVLKDCEKNTKQSCLTDAQADEIFNTISYPEGAACVDKYVPNLPSTKRAAIIDVSFAGCGTLNQFVKMKAALQKQDWQQAANELRSSKWCTDVKAKRCNADYNCLIDGLCKGGVCGAYAPGCSSNPNCFCLKMSNGTGFCSQDFYCKDTGSCNSCPSSTSVCLVDTCCGQPVCVSLSVGSGCKSSSKSLISDLLVGILSKQSNEKTAAYP